jgi:hypothetical protein
VSSRFNFSSSGWRNPSNPWFRVGEVEVTTTVLITAIGVISMFIWALNPRTFDPFYFITDDFGFGGSVRSGQIWRLATWPLVNAPSLWSVITLALFWYFGRDVEAMFGRNRYLGFLGAITVIPATIVFLLSLIPGVYAFHTGNAGMRLIEMGIFAVFVAEHLNARFFFGIPAWAIGLIFLALDVLQFVGVRAWGSLWHELLIVALSLLLVRAFGFADDLHWVPRLPFPGSPGKQKSTANARRPAKPAGRKRGRQTAVVSGPWAGSPTSGFDQQLLDRLLDKVASGGIASLSATERKQLDELSRRIREER